MIRTRKSIISFISIQQQQQQQQQQQNIIEIDAVTVYFAIRGT